MQGVTSQGLRNLIDAPIRQHTVFHFSGHGVTVVGRPTGIIYDESPYIVWDGRSIRWHQPTKWHDCMVFHDMHLVSLQRVRNYLIVNGVEPVIIFPCQVGESSIEVNIPSKKGKGIVNGLATYCQMKVLTKTITVRDFITQSNQLSKDMGFDRVGEVICREELLNDKLMEPEYKLKPVFLFLLDMCRVYGNIEDYEVDHDYLSP